jgi:uncharacterized membrane protein (UPF0127 family)
MRRILAVLISLTALAACADDAEQTSPPDPPSSTMTFGGTDATLAVEVADETDEQQRGLMGIHQLPADQGMAFVWPEPVGDTFWMKDTLISLSIAFVGEDGRVIDVLDMQPCETDPCPTYGVDEPYVLAVEANLGWFDDHGVEAGDRAELRASLYG